MWRLQDQLCSVFMSRACVFPALYYSAHHTSSTVNQMSRGGCLIFFPDMIRAVRGVSTGCVCLLIYMTLYTIQALVPSDGCVVSV